MKKVELLAPAGSMEKFFTALHFGADAVYLSGKEFGLRAFSENFTFDEIKSACEFAHAKGKKVYVTVNIFASDTDIKKLPDYFKYLEEINADAALVSDPGVFSIAKKSAPKLPLHISTQANITNSEAALFWAGLGAERVVLARELPLEAVALIAKAVEGKTEIEAFVHGAMCISMSGRCLLSNYLSGRDANRGECVQACRWEYLINEVGRDKEKLTMLEDGRGTYILNSKDMNTLPYLKEIINAGVNSLKIEGRMKSAYYVATVVNAYRRALDAITQNKEAELNGILQEELEKTSHRKYTTGFFFGDKDMQCYETSKPQQVSEFAASVIESGNGFVTVEQRNRFKAGDILEVVAPDGNFLEKIEVTKMYDESGGEVPDAKLVQQVLKIPCKLNLRKYDILRK